MTLLEFFNAEYKPRRLFGKSPNTTRLYLLSIQSYCRTIGRQARLEDLTDNGLRRHMESVVAAGRSPATANKDRAQLLALWRLAFHLRLHDVSPDVQPYKEPERTPVAWLSDELAKLFDTINGLDGFLLTVPRSLWWHTLIRLSLETGERIGALANAQWLWLRGEWLFVPAEARKGSRSDRCYRLSPEVVAMLEQIRQYKASDTKIFVWPYCSAYLWTKYKDILKLAKLPHGRRDMFHKHRRTTGSVAYAAGLDPQDVLDHQYRRTTKRYLDVRFTRTQQPCDILASYLASPGLRDAPPASLPQQRQA